MWHLRKENKTGVTIKTSNSESSREDSISTVSRTSRRSAIRQSVVRRITNIFRPTTVAQFPHVQAYLWGCKGAGGKLSSNNFSI